MTPRPVSFPAAGGTKLRGTLHLPAGRGPFGAIAMAHGFSATRDMGVEQMAAVLADAGFVALAYDHRNLGESEGEPRQEINPFAQTRDYRHALSWLAARAEVDPGRLGVWGSSFSGGEVLVLGAVDDRVRAVVAQVPFAGTTADPVDPGGDHWAALRDAVLDDDAPPPGADADPLGPLPVVADGSAASPFLGDPHARPWFEAAAGPGWRNEVTVRGLLGDPPFDPALGASHVHAATLAIVAAEDALAPPEIARAALERIPAPTRVETVLGDHFVVYGAAFDHVAAVTTEFLREHL